jgi:uncharacterized membrane protein YphA (DoxX/SURF4 family)
MKMKLFTVTRLGFGILFVIFGLNGFLNFIPMPTPSPQAADFLGALFQTGFIFPVIKSIEILVGISMLTNRYTTLSLVVIAPILTVITLHNFLLDPSGIPLTLLIMGMYGTLIYNHRANYQQLIQAKAI